ncbi:MAG: hypothetical protein ABR575_02465 [Actinomycetota bacterium]
MSDDRFLHIYLNDHLSGSMAGIEIAKRAAGSNEGTPLGDFLTRLEEGIDEDRSTLERIMDAVGARRQKLKEAAAWLGEKVGRLKLNGQLVGYSDLSRLVELEALALGVEGKMALWRSLRQLAETDQRLDRSQLDELIVRCQSQRDEIERFRLSSAAAAFSTSSTAERASTST